MIGEARAFTPSFLDQGFMNVTGEAKKTFVAFAVLPYTFVETRMKSFSIGLVAKCSHVKVSSLAKN